MFQFTHPRGVRPREAAPHRRHPAVSIHAPARGATLLPPFVLHRKGVSIHAPARGATRMVSMSLSHNGVSIHAPARGATAARLLSPPIYIRFNSRTREGCDVYAGLRSISTARFNSRTREGCDLSGLPGTDPVSRFNSRTREGCDLPTAATEVARAEFQFTHPRGVRQPVGHTSQLVGQVSIHAPARGATSGGTL